MFTLPRLLVETGLIALANSGDEKSVNMKLDWYFWRPEDRELLLSMSPEELFALPFTPLYVRYVATRDILPGEELVIDYGDGWRADWKVIY